MPLVSIIVPVYKVEKLLRRCVYSLINQTLKDIEIILVDDGSPDQSGMICDEFQKKDVRVKVIHKENGGLSSARNAGLKIAQGRYIGFVDSDDTVALDMYEKMYKIANKENAECVLTDYYRIDKDGNKYIKTLDIPAGLYEKEKMKTIIYPNLIMKECIDYGPLLSVWCCLYSAEFLKKHNLYFDEQIRWSEDNIFSSIMGYFCERLYYLKGKPLYNYYQNPGTITTSYREGAWEIYCKMNEHLHLFFDYIEDYDFSRQLNLHLIYYACNCIGQELKLSPKKAKEEIRKILDTPKLKKAFKNFEMPNVNLKLRVQLYLMKWKQVNLLYRLKNKI